MLSMNGNGIYEKISPKEKYELLRAHQKHNDLYRALIADQADRLVTGLKVQSHGKSNLGHDSAIEIVYEIGLWLNRIDYPPR